MYVTNKYQAKLLRLLKLIHLRLRTETSWSNLNSGRSKHVCLFAFLLHKTDLGWHILRDWCLKMILDSGGIPMSNMFKQVQISCALFLCSQHRWTFLSVSCISNDFGCRLQLLSIILSLNCKSKLKLIQSQSPRIYKTSVEEYISCYATTAIT